MFLFLAGIQFSQSQWTSFVVNLYIICGLLLNVTTNVKLILSISKVFNIDFVVLWVFAFELISGLALTVPIIMNMVLHVSEMTIYISW